MRTKLRHPIRAIREPFGTAGLIIACVALIAALGGSAIAARGLTGQEKKEVKKIAKSESKKFSKKFAKSGPAGPAGPAGLPGPAGANGQDGLNGLDGEDGQDGEDGEDGTDGTSVNSSNEPIGTGNCGGRGGSKFVAGASTTYACNGEDGAAGTNGIDGEPWVPENTLPEGATLTGAWSLGPIKEGEKSEGLGDIQTTLSFVIPLPAELGFENVHFLAKGATATSECPGTPAAPEALAGHLCVYTAEEAAGWLAGSTPSISKAGSEGNALGASTAGAFIRWTAQTKGAYARGTYAVTAPTTP